jgi:hypothetical protein
MPLLNYLLNYQFNGAIVYYHLTSSLTVRLNYHLQRMTKTDAWKL